jgi:hypothetical protein
MSKKTEGEDGIDLSLSLENKSCFDSTKNETFYEISIELRLVHRYRKPKNRLLKFCLCARY